MLGNKFLKMFFTRSRFEQIKHCLMVGNPRIDENAGDPCSKFRAFLEAVRQKIQEWWIPSSHQCLDESQQQCGHRNARISHRGESHKPLSDFLNFISAHECKNAYCYSFIIDERQRQVSIVDMIVQVLQQYPDATRFSPSAPDEVCAQSRSFAADRFYVSVDAVDKVWRETRHFLWGTTRRDRGAQHSGINMTSPMEDGDFLWRQADLPMEMTICRWRDSDPKGSWFLSPLHDAASIFFNNLMYNLVSYSTITNKLITHMTHTPKISFRFVHIKKIQKHPLISPK